MLVAQSSVLLRPWRKEDAQSLSAIANNKKIWLNVRDRFPHPYTAMDAMQWIQAQGDLQPTTNFCIEYNQVIAGSIGIVLQEDVYRRSIEIGYFVGEPFWGLGIASEAVRFLLQYIFEEFKVDRIVAMVFASNLASMKVLRKNGFYLESIRKKAVVKNGVVMDDYVWVQIRDIL